jgi:hypothetical protein
MSEKKPRRPGRKPGIALLGVLGEQTEAAIWESMLKAEGIPCLVRNLNATASYGASLPPGPFEVYVPGSALKRAQGVVGSALSHDRSRTLTTRASTGQRSLLPWVLLSALAVLSVAVGITLGLLFR